MTWWGGSSSAGSVVGGGGSGSGEAASELIAEAKALVDDEHESESDWIDPARWLRWLNWERKSLAMRSVQMAVIRPPILETTFTGHTTTITDAMAIVSVYDDTVGQMLQPAQSQYAGEPFYPFGGSYSSGPSQGWAAYANGNSFTVELFPRDTSHTYRVRYVPAVTYVDSVDDLVLVPIGWERRIIYGMVRHALVKESARSAEIRDLIKEADAEIGLEITGRGEDGPRVRNRRRNKTKYNPADPRSWVYA